MFLLQQIFTHLFLDRIVAYAWHFGPSLLHHIVMQRQLGARHSAMFWSYRPQTAMYWHYDSQTAFMWRTSQLVAMSWRT